jgi:hypothetical protein
VTIGVETDSLKCVYYNQSGILEAASGIAPDAAFSTLGVASGFQERLSRYAESVEIGQIHPVQTKQRRQVLVENKRRNEDVDRRKFGSIPKKAKIPH